MAQESLLSNITYENYTDNYLLMLGMVARPENSVVSW